jgi:hypothetical protein
MTEELDQNLARWKEELEDAWRQIPKPFRSDRAVHRTLQCHLYTIFQLLGSRTVADYMPPRIADRPVDVITLNEENEVIYAFCFDIYVSLASVKSLGSFAAENKIIFTTGPLEKKVQESRFFLNAEIKHLHLTPFER